jgi:hypothetical protein
MWLQALFFSIRTEHFGHSFVRAANQISVAANISTTFRNAKQFVTKKKEEKAKTII